MAQATRRLPESGPTTGAVLTIDSHAWTVGDRATYGSSESGDVEEWECRSGTAVAYLLREGRESPKWFFTREVPPEAVALPGGEVLTRWIARSGATAPPAELTYRGQTYRLAERVDGTYRESDGDATAKTTWEYWDPGHAFNLAIERWPDGTIDGYHGRYLSADEIAVGGTAASRAAWVRRYVGPALVILPMVFFFLALTIGQVDSALSVMLLVVSGVWLIAASVRASGPGGISLLATPISALLFARFPPLTSMPGLAAVLVLPAAITRWGTMRDATVGRASRGAATAMIAVAVLAAGLYHYFWFAPGPRTFEQYLLAIGPAPIAAVIALLVSSLVIKVSD